MKASVLISTVGSSLLYNIEGDKENRPELYDHYQGTRWPQVARVLKGLDPSERVCGAEINSVHALRSAARYVTGDVALHFLVSDTPEGASVGSVLKSYYGLEEKRIHRIEGLNDSDAETFRRAGLRNLVSTIAAVAKGVGDLGAVALNPLGGYKAEIAVAGLVGQALGIPVFYKYEKFDDVIVMPPMPLAFDDSLYTEHIWLFSKLSGQKTVEIDMDDQIDERLLPFLEIETIDGRRLVSMAFIGTIFIEGYEMRHPSIATVPRDAAAAERKEPSFSQSEHHFPNGFKDVVWSVWNDTQYVKTCRSVESFRSGGNRENRFRFDERLNEIVGEFRSDYGSKYIVFTTAETSNERNAALRDLNTRYG